MTIRLAYLSLIRKLQAREPKKTVTVADIPEITISPPKTADEKNIDIINAINSSIESKRSRAMTLDTYTQEVRSRLFEFEN